MCSACTPNIYGTNTTFIATSFDECSRKGVAGWFVLPAAFSRKGSVLIDIKEFICEVLRQVVEVKAQQPLEIKVVTVVEGCFLYKTLFLAEIVIILGA